MPHLLVDISAHGFGHATQTAPVINALAARIPGLRISVRSAAPLALLQQRLHCDFRHIPAALDFGMRMATAVDVEIEASAAAYREYHRDWGARVQRAAREMRALQPDLLLANVPYLSLAAARAAGVRAAAMCCLNWADIYRHYCAHDAPGAAIHAQMLAACNSAEVFLKVQPAMPMPELERSRSIDPVVQPGRNRREELDRAYPAARTRRLVLAAMGGIEFRLPMEQWPRLADVHWLVPRTWNIEREDVHPLEASGLPFCDLLASCDAVLGKPGYGTFTEAACTGVPVLYVARGDWPEEPYLVQWLEQHGACREVARNLLQNGDLEASLHGLWAQPRPPRPAASGAEQAAEILSGML